MKTNKLRKIISIMLIMILSIAFGSIKSYAATGSFSVSPSSASIDVGGSTTIKITATNCGGQFTFKSSDSSIVSVSASQDWIESTTSSITLTGKKAGTATITITASDVADTSENAVTGSKTVKVTVKEKSSSTENAASNNNSSTTTKTESAKVSSCTVNGVTIKESLKVTNKESVSVVIKTSTGENATIVNSLTRKILYS